MDKIREVRARQIPDSRGKPTVEAQICIGKFVGKASVPSGASTGKHEAVELNAKKAINNVNRIISKKLIGKALSQNELDNLLIKLDGTKNKAKLGANATLAVSLAFSRAAALSQKKPLYIYISGLTKNKPCMPIPFLNVINGGRHAKNNLLIQEFMIVPKAQSFKESMKIAKSGYQELRKLITKKFGKPKIGDEGGFAPGISTAEEALNLLEEAVSQSGHTKKIKFAVDAAASETFKNGKYLIKKGSKPLTAEQLTDYYLALIKDYKIISLEDPFEQDKFNDFANLTKKAKVQIVGDDLLATNISRINKAAKIKACNCLLLKPNQAGTLTEAINAAKLAKRHGWKVMVSHRSGETKDSFIADLAAGGGYGQIKAGAPYTIERMAKYNRLLRIEKELKK